MSKNDNRSLDFDEEIDKVFKTNRIYTKDGKRVLDLETEPFDFKNIAETCNHFAGEAITLTFNEFSNAKKSAMCLSASKSRPNGFRLSFKMGNRILTDNKWFMSLVEYHNEEFVEKINIMWKRVFKETDPDNKGRVEITGVGIDLHQPWMEFCLAE